MTAILTADIDGQKVSADLALVTALDAAVYEQSTGSALDLTIARLLETAPESDTEWRLLDRAIIKWLFVRQSVDRDATVASVLASVTFLPAPAGGVDAPEAG